MIENHLSYHFYGVRQREEDHGQVHDRGAHRGTPLRSSLAMGPHIPGDERHGNLISIAGSDSEARPQWNAKRMTVIDIMKSSDRYGHEVAGIRSKTASIKTKSIKMGKRHESNEFCSESEEGTSLHSARTSPNM